MKTSIERMRDHETGGVRITVNLDPRDLEGLGAWRTDYPLFELTMIPHTATHEIGDSPVPITRLLRSEFANLLAQVIVAELVHSGALPRPDPLRPLTPERKRFTTRR